MAPAFHDYVREHPEMLGEIGAIAAHYIGSNTPGDVRKELSDYIQDELRRQWPNIRTSWKAFAHRIARVQAPKLAARARRRGLNNMDPEILESNRQDDGPGPDQLVIDKEEREYIQKAMATLRPHERDILQAFARARSRREAARMLNLSESTYRESLRRVISKIQPKPPVRPKSKAKPR